MQTSEQVNLLYEAVVKAMGEMKSVPKNGFNPHYNSRYVLLDDVQEMSRPILQKHGLALMQSVVSVADEYFMHSRLVHTSGQWQMSVVKLILFKKDMQGMGSADTYAKRYHLTGLIGIAGDQDDDGNGAAKPQGQPQQQRQNNPKPAPAKPQQQAAAKKPPTNYAPATPDSIDYMYGMIRERGVDRNIVNALVCDGYGYRTNPPQWVINEINGMLDIEDCTDATLQAKRVRLTSEREAARIKAEAEKGGAQ